MQICMRADVTALRYTKEHVRDYEGRSQKSLKNKHTHTHGLEAAEYNVISYCKLRIC